MKPMHYYRSRLLLTVFILLNYFFCFSQNKDSIIQVIQKQKGEELVESLIKLGNTFYVDKDTASAIKYTQMAVQKALKVDDIDLIFKSTYSLGFIFKGIGEINRADSIFNGIIETAESVTDTSLLIYFYKDYAYIKRDKQDFKESLTFSKIFKNYALKTKNYMQVLNASKLIALNLYNLGKPDEAIENFIKARKYAEKINAQRDVAGMNMNIGVLLFKRGKYQQSLENYKKAYEIFLNLKDTLNTGKALENIGITFDITGDLDSALYYKKEALELYKDLNINNSLINGYNNIFFTLNQQGQYTEALKYLFQALEIAKDLDDEIKNSELANLYINMGIVYKKLHQNVEAMKYTKKGLTISEKLNFRERIAESRQNIAQIYYNQKEYDSALVEVKISLEIMMELDYKTKILENKIILAKIYYKKNKYEQSKRYYNEGIKLAKQLEAKDILANAYNGIGGVYLKERNFPQAEKYLKKSLNLLNKSTNKPELLILYHNFSNLYYNIGQYKRSADYMNKYNDLNEELINQDLNQQLSLMGIKFDTAEKKQQIALLQKEKEANEIKDREKSKRNKIIVAFFGVFFLLITLLVIILYRGNRKKRKQNNDLKEKNQIIEKQKQLVDLKNNEILDSIQYARNIQSAILPSNEILKKENLDNFILFQPKDIVSGDFYWIEEKNDVILFAVADCTGHGVPGAMVSFVCHQALQSSINEHEKIEPADILNKTRTLVSDTFVGKDKALSDGMDIALCSYNKRNNILQFAGANNNLYLVRNNNLVEYKADRQPVGKFVAPKPFRNHTIQVENGDIIYLFSDGYIDQFGGDYNKKMKSTRFKSLLVALSNKKMHIQSKELKNHFDKWKDGLEQIDDVTILGVRF